MASGVSTQTIAVTDPHTNHLVVANAFSQSMHTCLSACSERRLLIIIFLILPSWGDIYCSVSLKRRTHRFTAVSLGHEVSFLV